MYMYSNCSSSVYLCVNRYVDDFMLILCVYFFVLIKVKVRSSETVKKKNVTFTRASFLLLEFYDTRKLISFIFLL